MPFFVSLFDELVGSTYTWWAWYPQICAPPRDSGGGRVRHPWPHPVLWTGTPWSAHRVSLLKQKIDTKPGATTPLVKKMGWRDQWTRRRRAFTSFWKSSSRRSPKSSLTNMFILEAMKLTLAVGKEQSIARNTPLHFTIHNFQEKQPWHFEVHVSFEHLRRVQQTWVHLHSQAVGHCWLSSNQKWIHNLAGRSY